MKSTVAAAIALVLAIAATTASAGVVISQELSLSSQPVGSKTDQTLMIQGHKQKFINGDREFITDLDAGKMYLLLPKEKQSLEMPFPPAGGSQRVMAREGLPDLPPGLKKTDRADKVAGYDCQDYTGTVPVAMSTLAITQCVSSNAPGAKEFVEFQKAMVKALTAQKAKQGAAPLALTAEIPDGIPLSTVSTRTVNPFKPSPKIPPEARAKIEAALARNKPLIRTTTVTKIEVKDLAADTFVVPADYNKNLKNPTSKLPPPPKPGAAPGSAMDHGAPAAPAASASH